MDFIDNFLKKVNKTPSCWIWIGATSSKGYGRIRINGKLKSSHRLSYELFKEKIPEGLFVCHSCDNPSCVNPEHLWIGTRSENMKDAYKKGRINKKFYVPKRGEEHGASKLNDKQVIEIRKSNKSNKELSKKYNMAIRTIQRIKKGDIWKHLPV